MTKAALTVAMAAEMYSIGQERIYNAIRAGDLPAKNVGEGGERLHARILVDDMDAWFRALPSA